MTIFYRLGCNLYVNITNYCPCACVFCIRNLKTGVGDANSLWLKREPTLSEIKLAFDTRQDINEIEEVVFCGYGEPMARANDVIKICEYIKQKTNLKVRINTNGLVKFLVPSFNVCKFENIVDSVSVSLNADDADEYVRIVNPRYGIDSYTAVINFAKEAKKYTNVIFTVLESLPAGRTQNCIKLANELGIPLRVRGFM